MVIMLHQRKNIGTTVIRKSVMTLVHEDQVEDAQPVADLLAHNLETAKKTYRIRNCEKQAVKGTSAIAKAWAVMEVMVPENKQISELNQLSQTSPMRLPWTQEDEDEVKMVYADCIKVGSVTTNTVLEKLHLLNCQKSERQIYQKLRALIARHSTSHTMSKPPVEEETLQDRVSQVIDTCVEDNKSDPTYEPQEPCVIDSNSSVITSKLSGLQKIFDTAECLEIKTLCSHVAHSGPVSRERIKRSLEQTDLGRNILDNLRMDQLQTRVKYERRLLRR